MYYVAREGTIVVAIDIIIMIVHHNNQTFSASHQDYKYNVLINNASNLYYYDLNHFCINWYYKIYIGTETARNFACRCYLLIIINSSLHF